MNDCLYLLVCEYTNDYSFAVVRSSSSKTNSGKDCGCSSSVFNTVVVQVFLIHHFLNLSWRTMNELQEHPK
jgi:hypothetical protein